MNLLGTVKLRFFEGLLSFYRGTGDLAAALRFLAARLEPSRAGAAAADAARAIEAGCSLTEAFSSSVPGLSPVEIGLLRVGERSGEIERALAAIVDGVRSERDLKIELTGRLAYPVIVLHLAGLVYTYIQSLFHGWSLRWPLLYFGLLYGLAGGGWYLYRRLRSRPAWQALALNLPLIGEVQKNLWRGRFAGALGQLYGAGVPIGEALHVVAEALPPGPAAGELRRAAVSVSAGEPLSLHLPRTLDDPLLRDAVAVGEQAGALSEHLARAHTFYRDHARRGMRLLAQTAGWTVYGVAVLVVVYVVFSFYLGRFAALGL